MEKGVHMHCSNRLEALADRLSERLGEEGVDDFFQPLTLVVQTPGVARWLSLRLADRMGCAMNLRYLFPRNFLDLACHSILGADSQSQTDVRRMSWRIFNILPQVAALPGSDVLAHYLAQTDVHGRMQLATRVADIFDRYLVHRPELLRSWDAGAEPDDWQARLWRELVRVDPLPRPDALAAALAGAESPLGRPPECVHLFALSTLPPLYLDMIASAARHMRVELYALSPSSEYWGDLPRGRARAVERVAGASFGQPLLSALGSQGMAFSNLLLDRDVYPESEAYEEPGRGSVLAGLQSDMLELRMEAGGPLVPDDSLKIACCCGPMREVEVLKNHILSLLDADPTLRPRDILVLAPKMDAFAPYVQAVFSSGPEEGRIPYSIADRGRRDQPLVAAFMSILDLASSRKTSRDVMSFIELPAVAQRHGLGAEDIASLRGMCTMTGVRWGLDESEREAQGFGPERRNSWKAGLDGMALGAMMSGEAVIGGVAPCREAEGDGLRLCGSLAEIVGGIHKAVRAVEKPRPLSQWPAALRECLDTVLPPRDADDAQRVAILECLAELGRMGDLAGPDEIDLRTARECVETMLCGEGSPMGFISGAVTFAELKPMRSVPARAICLLGMDAEAFPRQDRAPAFDRMAREPRMGDFSVREGDRHLFLETLLCARGSLWISYSGSSAHGEAEKPPSAVVSELCEYLGPAMAGMVTRHPLHPFARANFAPDGPLFSYSKEDYEAALAAGTKAQAGAFDAGYVEVPEGLLEPDFGDIVDFFTNPARFFLRNVMGLEQPRFEDDLEDEEPVALTGLERYSQREEIADRILAGGDAGMAIMNARARGVLPWGLDGESEAQLMVSQASVFCNAVKPLVAGRQDRVSGVLEAGGVRASLVFSPVVDGRHLLTRCGKMRTKDILRAWLAAVFLGALREKGWDGVSGVTAVFEGGEMLKLGIPPEAAARAEALLGMYREGLTTPLPLPLEGARAYCKPQGTSKKTPQQRAMEALSKKDHGKSEKDDPWNQIVWRGTASLDGRFETLARLLWDGFDECAKEGADE